MKKYNYSNIKKQFKLLLASIHEGQQSVDFDWNDCCGALSQVANAKLNIDNFLDFEGMMRDVHVRPIINRDTTYNYNHIPVLKIAKELAVINPHNVFPYFMWDNYIYDAKTGKRLCHRVRANVPEIWGT